MRRPQGKDFGGEPDASWGQAPGHFRRPVKAAVMAAARVSTVVKVRAAWVRAVG